MIVTNWSTFAGDVRCTGTTPELHLPVLDAATVSLFQLVTLCFIFQEISSRFLGLWFFGKEDQIKLMKESVVVRDAINDKKMFQR